MEKLRFAGDVVVSAVQIIGSKGQLLNISNLVAEIQIFEDIHSPFTTGKIILQDSMDLINHIPFIGQEYLRLEIRTPLFNDEKKSINEVFYIYKMSNRERTGEKAVAYMLHFISAEALYDMNLRFSKAFEGTGSELVSKIIQSAFVTQKQFAMVEPTTNKNKFVACNWSPLKVINYICKTSVNATRSNYLFFENRYGWNFTTPQFIFQTMPVYQKFELSAQTRPIQESGATVKDPGLDYTKIIDFHMPVGFDYADRTLNGMFSSKIITHDYVTKKYSTKVYSVIDEFKKQPSLNPYPVFTEDVSRNSGAMFLSEPKHYGIHNGQGDISNTKYALERLSLSKMSEAFKINVTVAGRTDYTVGQVVDIRMPTFEPHKEINDPNNIDRMFSGKYMISAINHVIKTDRHETHMELVKDSLIFNLDA